MPNTFSNFAKCYTNAQIKDLNVFQDGNFFVKFSHTSCIQTCGGAQLDNTKLQVYELLKCTKLQLYVLLMCTNDQQLFSLIKLSLRGFVGSAFLQSLQGRVFQSCPYNKCVGKNV